MAGNGARVQPEPGNDRAVADSEQPKPAIIPMMNNTATSQPCNVPIVDKEAHTQDVAVNIDGEGSWSVSPAVGCCESKIKADFEFLWRLRKYLLILAVLAVSITYNVGLSPPGGFQMDNSLHHSAVAGDPLLPVTFFRRYEAFFYCNATAFAASLVLIILLLSRGVANKRVWLRSMQVTMILDLFSLMGAYAAGSCRAIRSSVFVLVLVCAVFVYVGIHVLVFIRIVPKWLKEKVRKIPYLIERKLQGMPNQMPPIFPVSDNADGRRNSPNKKKEIEEARKFILMLATFAATITYQAGMSPPGGFWGANGHGYRPGTFVLRMHNLLRFNIFMCCNAASFVASLVTVILLLSTELSTHGIRTRALYVCVIVDLLGLIGAYAAGSSRNVGTSLAVVLIILVVLICVLLLVMLLQSETATCLIDNQVKPVFNRFLSWLSWRRENHQSNLKGNDSQRTYQQDTLKKSRTYLLFLAILAVSLTYQAGLNPPGGFWTSNATNHLAGDPILEDSYHKRYIAFFYLNATAFAASIVMIIMLLSRKMSSRVIKRRALQIAMITDLLALMGTFVVGSCREKSKTIYISVMIFPVVAYVCLHVSVSGHIIPGWWNECIAQRIKIGLPKSPRTESELRYANEKDLEGRRNLLFVLAILAATVTYQAGLNPPGGIWPDGSTYGKPGNPALQDSHPKRYNVFYYSNAASFVSSIPVIILLVNRESCEHGIKSYALRVCLVTGLLALLVAYSAGSCRKLKSVIYLIAIAAVVLMCLGIQVLVLSSTQVLLEVPLTWLRTWLQKILRLESDSERSRKTSNEANKNDSAPGSAPQINATTEAAAEATATTTATTTVPFAPQINEKKENKRYKYLMLLAILAASIAYQAGLNPPGGFWPDDTPDGYKAGNLVLKDIHYKRYMVFFVFNSISFMSSIAVVMLLLSKSVRKKKVPLQALHFIMIVDLLALMTAYAAGSCRKFRTSIFVLVVVCCVVVYLVVVIILSSGIAKWLKRRKMKLASLLGMS